MIIIKFNNNSSTTEIKENENIFENREKLFYFKKTEPKYKYYNN
jgi:hypothetical protein